MAPFLLIVFLLVAPGSPAGLYRERRGDHYYMNRYGGDYTAASGWPDDRGSGYPMMPGGWDPRSYGMSAAPSTGRWHGKGYWDYGNGPVVGEWVGMGTWDASMGTFVGDVWKGPPLAGSSGGWSQSPSSWPATSSPSYNTPGSSSSANRPSQGGSVYVLSNSVSRPSGSGGGGSYGGSYGSTGQYPSGGSYGSSSQYPSGGSYGSSSGGSYGSSSGGSYGSSSGGSYGSSSGGSYGSSSQYPSGGSYGSSSQYPSGGSYGSSSQYPSGGSYGSSSQYPSGGSSGSSSQYPSGGSYGSSSQYPSGGSYGSSSQYPSGGSYGSSSQYPNGGSYGTGGSSGYYGSGGASGQQGSTWSSAGSGGTYNTGGSSAYGGRPSISLDGSNSGSQTSSWGGSYGRPSTGTDRPSGSYGSSYDRPSSGYGRPSSSQGSPSGSYGSPGGSAGGSSWGYQPAGGGYGSSSGSTGGHGSASSGGWSDRNDDKLSYPGTATEVASPWSYYRPPAGGAGSYPGGSQNPSRPPPYQPPPSALPPGHTGYPAGTTGYPVYPSDSGKTGVINPYQNPRGFSEYPDGSGYPPRNGGESSSSYPRPPPPVGGGGIQNRPPGQFVPSDSSAQTWISVSGNGVVSYVPGDRYPNGVIFNPSGDRGYPSPGNMPDKYPDRRPGSQGGTYPGSDRGPYGPNNIDRNMNGPYPNRKYPDGKDWAMAGKEWEQGVRYPSMPGYGPYRDGGKPFVPVGGPNDPNRYNPPGRPGYPSPGNDGYPNQAGQGYVPGRPGDGYWNDRTESGGYPGGNMPPGGGTSPGYYPPGNQYDNGNKGPVHIQGHYESSYQGGGGGYNPKVHPGGSPLYPAPYTPLLRRPESATRPDSSKPDGNYFQGTTKSYLYDRNKGNDDNKDNEPAGTEKGSSSPPADSASNVTDESPAASDSDSKPANSSSA